MRLSIKQNKNLKLWDVPEVTSFITNLSLCSQLHWAWSKQKAWFHGKKAPELFFCFGLNTFLDVIEIPKPQKPCWPYRHFKWGRGVKRYLISWCLTDTGIRYGSLAWWRLTCDQAWCFFFFWKGKRENAEKIHPPSQRLNIREGWYDRRLDEDLTLSSMQELTLVGLKL